jgi:hypothetical protein
MLKHIVIFKLKEFAEGNSKLENARLIKQRLEELPTIIPQIFEYEIGLNSLDDPRAYDMALIALFKSIDDFLMYRNNPEHIKVLEFIMKRTEDAKVVDYFLDKEESVQ